MRYQRTGYHQPPTTNFTGFTLIELMIVIAIITIITTIGVVSYSSVIQNSRDSKRLADLTILQGALAQYNSDQYFYPSSNIFSSTASASPFTNQTGNPNPPATVKTYLQALPVDPLVSPQPQYCYQALSDSSASCDNLSVATRCTKYELYTQLEATTSGSLQCGSVSTYNLKITPP